MSETCPSHDELHGFALGALPEARVGELEAHLGSCPQCLATLQGLPAGDTLTDALRALHDSQDRLPAGEAVTRVIDHVKQWTAAAPDHELALAQLRDRLEPAQAPDELGRLGPYRVLGVLGAGGMGIVLLGEDPLLGRRVALKVLSPLCAARPGARQRFLREARAVAGIAHPAVIEIYNVGEHGGLPYFAMPCLQGESLDARLRRDGPLPAADIVRIGRQLAEGLAAAHRHGVLHRDVKPANVWLAAPGDADAAPVPGRVRLLDFGLAWAADQGEPLTEAGTIIGTPAYMAPEQAAGGPVDARADLFALGSVLYTMATGRPPFAGASVYAILDQVRNHRPRPVRADNPAIPAALAAVIERLHAREPARRFQTAAEAARALARISDSSSAPGEAPVRSFRFKALVAVTLVLGFGIASLLAGVGGIPGLGSRPEPPGPAAPGPAPSPTNDTPAEQPIAAVQPEEKPEAKGPAVYPAALFPFEERGTGVKEYGAKVTDLLFARLAARPELHLVDRADLKKLQGELELGLSGAVKESQATRVDQLTGARLFITGSVRQVDKKTYLVARIIGTETSQVVGVSVDGKASDDLAPLVDHLADRIAEQIKEKAGTLVGKAPSPADRVANLAKLLKEGPRPTVIVQVRESHLGVRRIDPAAQTELMRLCKAAGFTVLDPEEGRKSKADVWLLGEAFSETALRNGNLVSVKARVELRAVDRATDQVIAADRQTSVVVDLAEQIAAKTALEDAAGRLAERILPRLVKK